VRKESRRSLTEKNDDVFGRRKSTEGTRLQHQDQLPLPLQFIRRVEVSGGTWTIIDYKTTEDERKEQTGRQTNILDDSRTAKHEAARKRGRNSGG